MKLNIELIEEKRIRQGLSKTALAEKAGVTKQLLNYYYNHPSFINNVSALAKALGCKGKTLLME